MDDSTLMTAEDAEPYEALASEGIPVAQRICATYHALAEREAQMGRMGADYAATLGDLTTSTTECEDLTAASRALRVTLAASQQEVERLRVREREALDAHAASFGALAAISRLTKLDGAVDDYGDVVQAVADALADARKAYSLPNDVARLRSEVFDLTTALAEAQKDGDELCLALAGSWFYGNWKAETPNERTQEAIMRRRGYWPTTEDELVARRTRSEPTP